MCPANLVSGFKYFGKVQTLCFRHETAIMIGIPQEQQVIKFYIQTVCDTFILGVF